MPSSFQFNSHSQKVQEWKSLKPTLNHTAPFLKEISLSLSKKYQETTRHAYLDEKGNLLFYVLRLVDKEDLTKKQIKSHSYGIWQRSEKSCWSLKNYQAEKRPLYLPFDQLDKNL